jgi:Bacterial Ig domain/Galactose oxidase, central domain
MFMLRAPKVQLVMRQVATIFAVLLAAPFMHAQVWQTIAPTGTAQPAETNWTNAVYDYQHKTLLLTQDDSAGGSGIYADTVYGFNPTNGLWTQIWVSDAKATQCPGNSATRPNHRHTYSQISWDTFRNQLNITSGSCQGALSYDWYSFTHTGAAGSGTWTQSANAATNPGNRQEGAMVYMPNVDKVLLYGGFTGVSGTTGADAWEYTPSTNSWTQICSSCGPGARHAHVMVYDNASGKVIIYGGQRSFGGASIAATYLYDPTAPVASRFTAANPTVEAPAGSYTCNGYDKQRSRLLIYPQQGHVLAYTVASNTWTDLGIAGGPAPDPGTPDGTADSYCGYDYDHDWFVFFASPGLAGGPPKTSGINFGNPPNTPPDPTPPTVSLTAPAAGTVSGTVTVSANASDNVGVIGVQFQLDGANLGIEDGTAPYSVSWNTTTATNGAHTLTAIARDAAGNRTTSAAVAVTVSNSAPVDTTPPTVSITAPANAASVLGTITVSANASDNVGVAGVQFQLDGVNLGAEDTASPYSVSWNTTTATNATHMLSAIARDAAGNKTTASVTVTVNNPVPDTTPPTVSITAPATGTTVSGAISVSANASDNVGVVGVQFQLDGANLGAEDTASPYSVSWNTTTATNATHTLSAIARDAAGNKTTATVSVTVSNIPPTSALGMSTDATTKFTVELRELAPLVSCPTCWFAAATDVMAGQTLEIRMRPGTNPAVADQVILKQGTVDGTVSVVGNNQFVIQPASGTVWPTSITVVTGSPTVFTGFPSSTGPVQSGQKVSVRGLLFKSTPTGVQLIASGVLLRP